MLDPSFFITIGLIFLLALVGAYLRSIVRDRCLKSWDGFHITLERTDGKLIWGVMRLEPSGIELSYLDTIQDEKHIESTYLLYNSDTRTSSRSTGTWINCQIGASKACSGCPAVVPSQAAAASGP